MTNLVIYKYPLTEIHEIVKIPKGGRVLSAGAQNDQIYIWVLINPNNTPIVRDFIIAGTGQKFSTNRELIFISRVTMGNFEFHVFEEVDD